MEDFESFFESQAENGYDINQECKDKFMDLVNQNNICQDEKLIGDWKSSLEAILINDSKFG